MRLPWPASADAFHASPVGVAFVSAAGGAVLASPRAGGVSTSAVATAAGINEVREAASAFASMRLPQLRIMFLRLRYPLFPSPHLIVTPPPPASSVPPEPRQAQRRTWKIRDKSHRKDNRHSGQH